MFKNIREKHLRKVLWALVIIIIPSFVLWGAMSYFKSKRNQIFARVGNKKISVNDFQYYVDMARIYRFLFAPMDMRTKITNQQLNNLAWEYILLVWKAQKEKIKVSDEEVVARIQGLFFQDARFDKDWYNRFLTRTLHVNPRTFEEYVRNFMMINKLFEKYAQVEITDEEVKALYNQANQKVKIGYILIPYGQFKDQITYTPQQIEAFYEKNKTLFKEEPKIKIRYTLVGDNRDLKDDILATFTQFKGLAELADSYSLEIKETDFITLKDPIEGIGWQGQINKIAFDLPAGQMSPPLEAGEEIILMEKIAEKASRIPPLDEIMGEVEEKYIEYELTKKTNKYAQDVLKTIDEKKYKDLRTAARKEGLEYTQTNFFGFNDYIEGMGLDERVSKIIYSMNLDEVFQVPILLGKGAYIIQLLETTPFKEKDFKEKENHYRMRLLQEKQFIERLKFLYDIEKEADVKIYPIKIQG